MRRRGEGRSDELKTPLLGGDGGGYRKAMKYIIKIRDI